MKKGFTLIELLAVIAIIGILGLLVVSNLTGVINNSKQDAYDLQVDEMISAARIYATENYKALPNLKTVGGRQYLTISDLVTLGYMDEVPTDPLTGQLFDVTNNYIEIKRGVNDKLEYKFVEALEAVSFNKYYGGQSTEENLVAYENPDGTFVFATWTWSEVGIPAGGDDSTGYGDIYVFKTDCLGNLVWEKTYGSTEHDEVLGITGTPDGGYILVGNSEGSDLQVDDGNQGEYDVWLMKVDASGNYVWNKTYGGTGSETAYDIKILPGGGYVVAARTASSDGDITDGNAGSYDVLLFKINELGEMQWHKTYGGTGNDSFAEESPILTLADGSIIVSGMTFSSNGTIASNNYGGGDIFLLKIDKNGNKIFGKTYGGTAGDYVKNLVIFDNNIYMLGNTASVDNDMSVAAKGNYDAFIIKLDENYDVLWTKKYGGSENDGFNNLVKLPNGNYLAMGYTFSSDVDISTKPVGTDPDKLILTLDSDFGVISDKVFGGSDWEESYVFERTSDGGYLLAGPTGSPIGRDIVGPLIGGDDIWVLKLKSDLTY